MRNGSAANAALPLHLSCPVVRDALDDAEKPKDQDQHQDTAKTDIHDTLLYWFWCCNGGRGCTVPVVTATSGLFLWYDFTRPESSGFA